MFKGSPCCRHKTLSVGGAVVGVECMTLWVLERNISCSVANVCGLATWGFFSFYCSSCVGFLEPFNLTEPPSVTGNFGRVVAAGEEGVAYIKSI